MLVSKISITHKTLMFVVNEITDKATKGKRLTRVVEVDHCYHWSYCSHCCPSIVHIGRPLDVHWTCTSIVENVQWSPMDTMDTVCPFFMTNGHVQWTQWMSIVSILVFTMDTPTRHQLVEGCTLVGFVQ